MSNERITLLKGRNTDDFVEIKLRVPRETLKEAWALFEEPIKCGNGYSNMTEYKDESPEAFFEDNELKLLCGVFLEASRCLPLDSYDYLTWIDLHDQVTTDRTHVDHFVMHRLDANLDVLGWLSNGELETLAAHALRLEAERTHRQAKDDARRQREKELSARLSEVRKAFRAEVKMAEEAATI